MGTIARTRFVILHRQSLSFVPEVLSVARTVILFGSNRQLNIFVDSHRLDKASWNKNENVSGTEVQQCIASVSLSGRGVEEGQQSVIGGFPYTVVMKFVLTLSRHNGIQRYLDCTMRDVSTATLPYKPSKAPSACHYKIGRKNALKIRKGCIQRRQASDSVTKINNLSQVKNRI